jgi:hypothetical protein
VQSFAQQFVEVNLCFTEIKQRFTAKMPIFIVHLQPIDDRDGIRALRWALKFLLRRFGLRAISVEEIHDRDGNQHSVAADRRHPLGRRGVARALRDQTVHHANP